MPPPILGREDVVDGRQEVCIRTCPQFDHRDPACGMWREHVQQSRIGWPQKPGDVLAQVDDRWSSARRDPNLGRTHGQVLSPKKISDTLESIRMA